MTVTSRAELNLRVANHNQTVVRTQPAPVIECEVFDLVCRVTANHNQTLVRAHFPPAA
jgi:hypothetical protein